MLRIRDDQSAFGNLGQDVPLPPAIVQQQAQAPAQPAQSSWMNILKTGTEALAKGSEAYASLIRSRAKSPSLTFPQGPYQPIAPTMTGPSMTAVLLIGGGVVAALAIAYFMTRN